MTGCKYIFCMLLCNNFIIMIYILSKECKWGSYMKFAYKIRAFSFYTAFLAVSFISYDINCIFGNWFSNNQNNVPVVINPDDIEQITTQSTDFSTMAKNQWVTVSKQGIAQQYGNLAYCGKNNHGIQTKEVFVPATAPIDVKPIVVVIVHGTFAQDSSSYKQGDSPFYAGVSRFARKLATQRNKPIEVISFRWTGSNKSAARKNGAIALASVLSNYYEGSEIITIAHSHGCNVVNTASRYLPSNVSIEHMIQIAAPVRDTSETDFQPQNFKHLTQFYSTSDGVAAVGAITPWWMPWRLTGSVRKFQAQLGRRVVNVRVQINGNEPGHSNIRALVTYMPEILEKMATFKFNTDLDLNLVLANNQGKFAMCEAQDGISNVLFSVRHYANSHNLLRETDMDDSQKFAVASQFSLEYQMSEAGKKMFKDYYDKDMHEKPSIFSRFRRAFNEEVLCKNF